MGLIATKEVVYTSITLNGWAFPLKNIDINRDFRESLVVMFKSFAVKVFNNNSAQTAA